MYFATVFQLTDQTHCGASAAAMNKDEVMIQDRQRLAMIFNEWAKRYSEEPEKFDAILDADGKPVRDYGERCAAYFETLANELGVNSGLSFSPPPV